MRQNLEPEPWNLKLRPVRHPDILDLRGVAQELALALARRRASCVPRPYRPGVLQIADRSALDRRDAGAEPPKYHSASTSSCSASTSASASRAPVTMLTTPPGTSLTCRAPGTGRWRESGWRSDGTSDDGVAHGDRRRHQRDAGPAAGTRRGRRCPITPIGSGIASVDAAIGRAMHRALVLVGPGGVA